MNWFEDRAEVLDRQAADCNRDTQVLVNAILLLAEVLYQGIIALSPGNKNP